MQLEHKLTEVENFYSTIALSNSASRHVVGIRKVQQEAARREAVAAKRMHDLMRQFGTIFRQVLVYSWCLCLQEEEFESSLSFDFLRLLSTSAHGLLCTLSM